MISSSNSARITRLTTRVTPPTPSALPRRIKSPTGRHPAGDQAPDTGGDRVDSRELRGFYHRRMANGQTSWLYCPSLPGTEPSTPPSRRMAAPDGLASPDGFFGRGHYPLVSANSSGPPKMLEPLTPAPNCPANTDRRSAARLSWPDG
jgi:hypothetical protein